MSPMFYEGTTSELCIVKTVEVSTNMNLTWQKRLGFMRIDFSKVSDYVLVFSCMN